MTMTRRARTANRVRAGACFTKAASGHRKLKSYSGSLANLGRPAASLGAMSNTRAVFSFRRPFAFFRRPTRTLVEGEAALRCVYGSRREPWSDGAWLQTILAERPDRPGRMVG